MTAFQAPIHASIGTLLIVFVAFATMPAVMAETGDSKSRSDHERGQALYRSCQACHGTRGEGSTAMNAPRLAGQFPWYLERQLQNFRSGTRGGPNDTYGGIMAPMAKGLPDDQAVRDVVSYIATF